ncbi:MAG: IS4 family transposase [Clostridiales Family XIII bacterium]|nr:IS4 family transposase [Clostridiales Family XIII bacterium]
MTKKRLAAKGMFTTRHELDDATTVGRFKTKASAFTRNRKMGFAKIVLCLLNFMKKSLTIEIERFHDFTGGQGPAMSKQAFSKARQNIDPELFRHLLRKATVEPFMEPDVAERHKGYRVFAIDGTDIEIEPTKENLKYYGTKGSDTACRAKASFLCEVIDGVIIDAIIGNNGNERTLAEEHIEYFSRFATEKDLIVFDRGYPGKKLIADLFDRNIKFLMRLQKSFDMNIDKDERNDFYADMKHKGSTYRLRVIKFLLESGEEETLITNLEPEDFGTEDFKELYFMRWAIETKYNLLKNCLLIEHFTGKTRTSIEQDFYAAAYLSNMAAFVQSDADHVIAEEDSHKKLKHKRQVNRQLLIGMLKDKFILMTLCDNADVRNAMLDSIMEKLVRYKTDIRPGRHYPRPDDCHHRRRHRLKGVL